jgi:hypothetical protein
VPSKGFYFVTGQMEHMEDRVGEWVVENAAVLRLTQPLTEAIVARHPQNSDVSDSATVGA